ncbi:MAG: MFS transporter [Alphaproteobacteria bacterium]|nr:MFS transporter [Alphaproteobacteria bacterium]MBL7096122.1 MFS transporter [Alphaproteobacteria bacterium]
MSDAAADPPEQPVSSGALPTLLSVMFINLLGFGIIVPLLPFYAKSFQAPAWQVALIFSAYAIGGFFGEPFWGRLSDTVGRKPILISTVCGNCLCYFALAFAPNIYVAFFVRLLGGMASGNGAVIQGYIADVTPPDERTGKMSWLGAAYNVGFIVGPALGGLLANPAAGHAGFRVPLLIASGLSAVCVVGLITFLKESRNHRKIGNRPNRWAVVHAAVTNPVIGRLMLVTLLAGCAFNGIESVFGLWTQARFAWGPQQVGSAFAVTGVVAAICQIGIAGPASKRFGEARTLAFGMLLTTLCASLQPFSTGTVTIVTLLAISAFGQSVAWPNVSALLSRNVDIDHQGQYLGLNNAVGGLARLVGPQIAAITFSNIDVDAPFFSAGLMVLPAIFFAWYAATHKSRMALSQPPAEPTLPED